MKELVGAAATAALVILFGWVGGCSSEQRCSYNGQSYPKGASFRATDDCNTCTCMAGEQVECTPAACLGDAGFAPAMDTAAADTRDSAIADVPPNMPLPIDAPAPYDTAPADYCQLPTGLTFHVLQQFNVPGSIASYGDTYHLDNTGLVITRGWYNGYDADYERTCTPVLPVCGLTDQIPVWNIGADLADPDVMAALASPPDTRFGAGPWSSEALFLATDGGGEILVGLPCTEPDAGPCKPIPPGLQRLKDNLRALAAAGAAQPDCVALLQL
jgi:hypothetical protein